ncbi:MAG: hypothetical protein K6D97_08685 [Clostridia bacterium]|nr:hypothetical protein [Clostridia bacterium]
MIKAKIDEKKNKTKVVLKGEGLEIMNEAVNLFAGITANVLNRVYDSDLNQMFQALDDTLKVVKNNCEIKMAHIVEKGGN